MARIELSPMQKRYLGEIILDISTGKVDGQEIDILGLLLEWGVDVPNEIQEIKFHSSTEAVLHVVVPEPMDVTPDVQEQETVIRNEHAAYVEAKERIDREKSSSGKIPDRTVSEAYLELIGHQALSYCSRLRG